ncbi:MAG: alpha/beta hydrolase [Acidobacteria bacterium]|nr:alpha/beta hydrolase [Acidobacteriota bacterium]
MPAPWLNSVDAWFAGGERVQVVLPPLQPGGAARVWSIFSRVAGQGPWLTLLHGFPTCSWDWAPIAPLLEPHRRLLLLDFLGFGDSDKPYRHKYSLFEQADIVEALWRRFEVERTEVVAHNYGVTVAQELFARKSACKLATRLVSATLLNGGVYPGQHRPLRIQRLLASPVLGPIVGLFVSEQTFRRNFSKIFSRRQPVSEAEMTEHWKAIARRDGVRNYHRLIRYMHERMEHRNRWTGAMESSSVPIRFLWGMQDPVAGAPMAAHIRERMPQAELVALEDVGHYPQIEVPQVVADEVLRR